MSRGALGHHLLSEAGAVNQKPRLTPQEVSVLPYYHEHFTAASDIPTDDAQAAVSQGHKRHPDQLPDGLRVPFIDVGETVG